MFCPRTRTDDSGSQSICSKAIWSDLFVAQPRMIEPHDSIRRHSRALSMFSVLCCSFLCFQKLKPRPSGNPTTMYRKNSPSTRGENLEYEHPEYALSSRAAPA